MTKVEHDGVLYAMQVSPKDDLPALGKTQWFGESSFSLQGSLMHYDLGESFRTHRHRVNPRVIERTQECFIVVAGAIRVNVSAESHLPDQFLQAGPGEAIFVWNGFHGLEILERGTIVYEFKAGSWGGSVAADKEFAQ